MNYFRWQTLGLLAAVACVTFVASTSLAAGPDDTPVRPQPGGQDSHIHVASSNPAPFVPGEILVMYKPGTLQSQVASANEPYSPTVLSIIPRLKLYHMKMTEDEVEKALKQYRSSPYVQAAQRNFIRYPIVIPDDEFYDDGQLVFGTADTNDFQRWYLGPTLLDAEAAWDLTTGRSDVVIAIIDSGIDLDHPDLAGNIWVNPGEVGDNGVDDDGNGKVDDINGWDFNSVSGGQNNDPNPDLGDGIDNDGNGAADDVAPHGTKVAGAAGAVGNNGTGVAGVVWNVQLMALKVFQDDGSAFDSDIIAAIDYAASKDADIINLSLGSLEADPCSISAPVFDAAITAAFNAGVLVVAAAGNENSSLPGVPASCTNALSVGDSDHDSTHFLNFSTIPKDPDGRASFSNFGQFVNVVAPGVLLLSTSVRTQADQNAGKGTKGTPFFSFMNGTSFSAPLVSGLAALTISRGKDLGLNLTPAQVRALIENHAVDLPDDPDDDPDGGAIWDGKGQVRFSASLDAIPVANDQNLTTQENTPLTITLTGSGPEGSSLSFSLVASTNNGSLGAITVTGPTTATLDYTPNTDFNNSDSFSFRVNDGFLDSNIATVSITVTPVNDPPVANAQSVTTPEDTPLTITLTGSDPEGSSLSFSLVASTNNGSLGVITVTGPTTATVLYTPNLNFLGADSFTFRVNDGFLDSNVATVSIKVGLSLFEDDFDGAAINSAKWNTSLAISGKRWCPPAGAWLDVSTSACFGSTETPPHGSVLVGGGQASFDAAVGRTSPYIWRGAPSRPSPFPATGDFILELRIRYDSIQGFGQGFQAIKSPNTDPVGGNSPVVPADQVFAAWGDFADGLFVQVLGQKFSVPSPNAFHLHRLEYIGGEYSLFVDSVLKTGPTASTLRPDSILIGNPIFCCTQASDHSDFTVDFVHVQVLSFADLALAKTDSPDPAQVGHNLTYTVTVTNNGPNPATGVVVTDTLPGGVNFMSASAGCTGTTTITCNLGTLAAAASTTVTIVVTPTATGTLNNTASVTSATTDTNSANDSGAVSTTVLPNTPPVANSQSVNTNMSVPVGIILTGSDADGDALTFIVVTNPTNGTLSGAPPNLAYTPDINFSGGDSFNFKVNDGLADSAPVTVSITIVFTGAFIPSLTPWGLVALAVLLVLALTWSLGVCIAHRVET